MYRGTQLTEEQIVEHTPQDGHVAVDAGDKKIAPRA